MFIQFEFDCEFECYTDSGYDYDHAEAATGAELALRAEPGPAPGSTRHFWRGFPGSLGALWPLRATVRADTPFPVSPVGALTQASR